MTIDWTSGLPAHEQIAGILRQRITAGSYRHGQPLHRRDLAAEFGVSTFTVSKATGLLKAEGLVVYRPSKGVLVVSPGDTPETPG